MKYLAVGLLILLGIGGTWYLGTLPASPFSPTKSTSTAPRLAYVVPPVPKAPALKPSRTPPQGYKEYRSEFYKFQTFYPQELTVTTRDEGQSAITLRFFSSDKEFQIFIVPYGAEKISESRFKTDNPSGVMLEPRDLTIDGVSATAFFSKDKTVGDTYEIWFIAKGFLYEITAPKALAPWLEQIVRTWQFL